VKALIALVKESGVLMRSMTRRLRDLQLCLDSLNYFFGVKVGFVTEIEGVRVRGPEELSPSRLKEVYQLMGSSLEINVYNSSSFACDSLLRDFPFELSSHGHVIRLDQSAVKAEVDENLSYDLKDYDVSGESLEYGNKRLGPVTKSLKGPRYHYYYPRMEEGAVVDKVNHQKA